ncbi:MAG: PLP-dependent transferase [Olsenella sp.]|nr:PLP-dependent transferase [Olsenella sp.]MCI1667082.1 PLP-dependent transferase [Olsenella sp.]MCI2123081.1 PLP-dependent transferase [Olsenella sp.]MCI2126661.1 PLP-dependent transferase [Olsenella sp.]MCI2183804.1 PLP-dependent transferase [Olsenella sp.]
MGEGDIDLDALSTLSSQMGRERWHALSDAAQVVANYLACHPRVEAVRYPGLKTDPDFARAASELVGGFGPYVAFRLIGAPAGEWCRWEADERDVREQVMELEVAIP